jgi:hypothetical protein
MDVVQLHPWIRRWCRFVWVINVAGRAFQFSHQPMAWAARISTLVLPLAVGPDRGCVWRRLPVGAAAGLPDAGLAAWPGALRPMAPGRWEPAACPGPLPIRCDRLDRGRWTRY